MKPTQTYNIRLYYISDHAYEKLVSIARYQGYIAENNIRSRGISQFFQELSLCEFRDTRPASIIKRHEQEIAIGHAPTWMSYYARRTRSISFTEQHIHNYLKIALQMGVIEDEPFITGGPKRSSYTSIVGYVLESIGLGWITPTKLPLYSKGVRDALESPPNI